MEIHPSARKHRIDDADIAHAVEHALIVHDLVDDTSPMRSLHLGPDRAGNLIEVIVLYLDDGRQLAIHAMRMRRIYHDLLP